MRSCHDCRVYNCEQRTKGVGCRQGEVVVFPGILLEFFFGFNFCSEKRRAREESASKRCGTARGGTQLAGEMTGDSCLVFWGKGAATR